MATEYWVCSASSVKLSACEIICCSRLTSSGTPSVTLRVAL
ncbi:hypothetical protein [Actinoplanes sp. L3-i22]|nr:hypothetical protein [Actinoplanes sp. L3-i22]